MSSFVCKAIRGKMDNKVVEIGIRGMIEGKVNAKEDDLMKACGGV